MTFFNFNIPENTQSQSNPIKFTIPTKQQTESESVFSSSKPNNYNNYNSYSSIYNEEKGRADLGKYALSFVGLNEADGSFRKLIKSNSDEPWCSKGWYEIMAGQDKGRNCSWLKNIGNEWAVASVEHAAKSAGAEISYDKSRVGDLVVLDWQNDGSAEHVAMVVAKQDNKIWTVECNMSDTVKVGYYTPEKLKQYDAHFYSIG